MTQEMPDEIGLVAMEIASREDMGDATERAAINSTAWFLKVVCGLPDVRIMLSIAGYDDDPRPLWEIAEVAEWVRRWAYLTGVTHWTHPAVRRLHPDSVGLLVLCCALGRDCPLKFKARKQAHP